MKKIILPGLLVIIMIIMGRCTSAPEWQKKNNELIKQYALTVRQLSGIPKINIRIKSCTGRSDKPQ